MSKRYYKNEFYETIDPMGISSSNILKSSKYYDENTHKKNYYNKLEIDHNNKNIYNKLEKKEELEELQLEELPEGWIKLFDENLGKYYYACCITKHTQWLNPTIPIGKMMPNGLPYGWEKEWDKDSNRYYYINHVGRFTTWSPPLKQRSYKGINYKW